MSIQGKLKFILLLLFVWTHLDMAVNIDPVTPLGRKDIWLDELDTIFRPKGQVLISPHILTLNLLIPLKPLNLTIISNLPILERICHNTTNVISHLHGERSTTELTGQANMKKICEHQMPGVVRFIKT